MDSDLAQGAIAAAIAGNWKSAIQLNTHILELRPDDIDALNRLARAYCEMSQLPEAISVCKKVLLLDPLNPIANKSLRRFEELESSGFSQLTPCVTAHPSVFVEEAGKTKNISLRNLGSSDLLVTLTPGVEVTLVFHDHVVNVTTVDGIRHIGRLPDDIALRLIKLHRAGNTYKAYLKRVEDSRVILFVRELFRIDEDIASFPSERFEPGEAVVQPLEQISA